MRCWMISEYGSPLHCVAKESAIGSNDVAEVSVPGIGTRNVHGTRLTRYWPGATIGLIAQPSPPSKAASTYSGYRSTFHRPHLD